MTDRLLFKYDGLLRELAYAMREIQNAWQIHVGVITPKAQDDEAQARLELAATEQAMTHAKNVLRTLLARREELADVLLLVERPRVDAAREEFERRNPVPENPETRIVDRG